MTIARVNYFEGQFLRAEDFRDEQSYQIAMRRRHNISHHSWGIVEGLEPQFVEGSLQLTPGVAVDGFGREVIVEEKRAISVQPFVELSAGTLEVWLNYATVTTTPPPKGYAPCHANEQANGQEQFYRVAEQPQLQLLNPSPDVTPRAPDSVAPSDLDFDATRCAPEDRAWPIFLGKVTFDPTRTDAPYSVDLSGRPYAGLIGEQVISPSGSARMQIGSEGESGSNRFAIFLPAKDTSPRLAIDEDGHLDARGETTVQGNLTIRGGALEIGVGPAVSPQPWRIYRVQETDALGASHDELRVEMAGDGAGNSQIVFGAWSEKDSEFNPCLTIGDDGTVTVSGNLVIKGQLDVDPDGIVPGRLSPQARAYVASGALASYSAGNAPAHGAAAPRTPHGAPAGPGAAPPSAVQRMRDLATALAEAHPSQEFSTTFIKILKTDFQDVAAKLKDLL